MTVANDSGRLIAAEHPRIGEHELRLLGTMVEQGLTLRQIAAVLEALLKRRSPPSRVQH